MSTKDENEALADVARETIDVTEDGSHAVVSVPGTSGHHQPGERRELAQEVLSDDRIAKAEHVTASVPLGDSEALDEVRERLHSETSRAAGSTVIVEGSTQESPGEKS